MKVATLRSQGSRVPPERISHTVWLYHRFCVSVQKTDDLLAPRGITDTLRRDAAAHRTVMSSVPHSTRQYDHTRAAVSHQPTRHRERPMRRLSVGRTSPTPFSRCRGSCCICFAWGATYCESSTIACSQHARAASGTR